MRIQGLPESHTDLEVAMRQLMKDLIPDISTHHVEIDRIHHALTAPWSNGLPRDVIVKPHHYRIKEKKMMFAARNRQDMSLFGEPIQLFTDLAPSMVPKSRNFRPLLQQLMNRQIKYRWAFPFKLWGLGQTAFAVYCNFISISSSLHPVDRLQGPCFCF